MGGQDGSALIVFPMITPGKIQPDPNRHPFHKAGDYCAGLTNMLRFTKNEAVSAASFRDILLRSTLGERRPVDDPHCLQGMIEHSNLIVTAWDGQLLVGIARSVTDFHYCCYLSDLAVDVAYQRQGIGRQLIQATQDALGPRCKIILLSAPAAVNYYAHLGFERHDQAWILARTKGVNDKADPRRSGKGHSARCRRDMRP